VAHRGYPVSVTCTPTRPGPTRSGRSGYGSGPAVPPYRDPGAVQHPGSFLFGRRSSRTEPTQFHGRELASERAGGRPERGVGMPAATARVRRDRASIPAGDTVVALAPSIIRRSTDFISQASPAVSRTTLDLGRDRPLFTSPRSRFRASRGNTRYAAGRGALISTVSTAGIPGRPGRMRHLRPTARGLRAWYSAPCGHVEVVLLHRGSSRRNLALVPVRCQPGQGRRTRPNPRRVGAGRVRRGCGRWRVRSAQRLHFAGATNPRRRPGRASPYAGGDPSGRNVILPIRSRSVWSCPRLKTGTPSVVVQSAFSMSLSSVSR